MGQLIMMKTAKNVGTRTPRWAQRELQTAGVSAVASWATRQQRGTPLPISLHPRTRSQSEARAGHATGGHGQLLCGTHSTQSSMVHGAEKQGITLRELPATQSAATE